jgi:quinol monooxygenase YgiN
MTGETENEAGCLRCAVFCDIQNENSFSLLQKWTARKDLDNYIASLRFGALLGMKALLSEPPKIQIYTISRSEGMEAIDTVRARNPLRI